jgi:hypothetical protein
MQSLNYYFYSSFQIYWPTFELKESSSQSNPFATCCRLFRPVIAIGKRAIIRAEISKLGFRLIIARGRGVMSLNSKARNGRSASYPSDLTEQEWSVIQPYAPTPKEGGRPAVYERRELVEAVLYLRATGCKWCQLPSDFPHWKTVYHYLRLWKLDGTWRTITAKLEAVASSGEQP